jgi:lipoate-protein ligase B
VDICDLGTVKYEDALHVQADLLQKRIENEIPDTLIVAEHTPVVTLGRTAEENNIIDKGFFDRNGIPVVSSGRGGKVTYHAPGQLVLYPVVGLGEKKRDIVFYIDFLEKTTARGLNRLGVPAGRINGKRGVWLRDKKIAFIGIAVKRWVTYHGVAININNDITPFARMHPCGESDIRVISAKEWLGRKIDMRLAKKVFAGQVEEDLAGEYESTGTGLDKKLCYSS